MTVTFSPRGGTPFTLAEDVRAIVAGYTGRDEAQVRHHIDELAAIGVAPPPQIPMVYPMPSDLLTASPDVEVGSTSTSGEVEPVYIRHGGHWYLSVGSDHTDRAREAVDIGESKQACPKPVSTDVVPVTDWSAFDFDACQASCIVDAEPYQQGSLAGLRRPEALLQVLTDRDPALADGDLVVFGGTLPLLAGTFRYGHQWDMSLDVPGHAPIQLSYSTKVRNP